MTIRVDSAAMSKRACQYRSEAQNIGRMLFSADELFGNLRTEWEDEKSASCYKSYMMEVRPSLQRAQMLFSMVADDFEAEAEAGVSSN